MSREWIDFLALKEQARFELVLSHYNVRLIGSGEQRSALCPFHQENTPSFQVNLERKIFNCFACGEKGNILDFIVKIENVPVEKAARILAGYSELDRGGSKSRKKKSSKSDVPATANPPLNFTLKNLDAKHPYLAERDIPPKIVEAFGLGYCKTGIMRGRIAIPIHDEKGVLVAYAGRWPGEPPAGVARYMVPRKFKKSLILFNLHRVEGSEHLVLVEGYFSVFRLAALNIAAVALMGSSLSDEQMHLLLASGARRLTLLLDTDDAGRKATAMLISRLSSEFFVRVPALPDNSAPDTIEEDILLAAVADQ